MTIAKPKAALVLLATAGTAAAAGVAMKPATATSTRPPISRPVSQFCVVLDARVLIQWITVSKSTTRHA